MEHAPCATGRPPPLTRSCESSRVQDDLLAHVYELLFPLPRRPSPPAAERGPLSPHPLKEDAHDMAS